MIEAMSGIFVAILIIIINQIVSKYFTTKLFAAANLIAIAFIYVGYSLKGNPAESIVSEVSVALVFFFMALIGFIRNNYLIAIGIILHGVWDIFHHNAYLISTDIPDYWPSFCLIIDIIDGIYFLIIFRKQAQPVLVTSSKPAEILKRG